MTPRSRVSIGFYGMPRKEQWLVQRAAILADAAGFLKPAIP